MLVASESRVHIQFAGMNPRVSWRTHRAIEELTTEEEKEPLPCPFCVGRGEG